MTYLALHGRSSPVLTSDAACRYLRAIEVGRSPTSTKYELAISLRTIKNGPVVRNRIQLPHSVEATQRVAVLCPPKSPAARDAKRLGAVLVGEDTILNAVKEGRIEFDRLLCHPSSQEKLNRAGVGRILGPKGLMPSPKTGTMVTDVGKTMAEMKGATQYREKEGVVRLPIGQLGFTPEMMMANIKLLMSVIKSEVSRFQDKLAKEIHEVVSAALLRLTRTRCSSATGSEFNERARLSSERGLAI